MAKSISPLHRFWHVGRLLIPVCSFAVSMVASGGFVSAQNTNFVAEYYERQTFNEGFESGLSNWQFKNGNSQGVTIEDWQSLPDDQSQFNNNIKFLTEPDDSRLDKVVKITGNNGLWQYTPVTGVARFQVACCNARKRLIPGQTGTMGWAGYGVIYYDAAWQEVARIEQQIFEFKTDPFNYLPPGYSQSTVGTPIPPTARHAILWLANDGANTELWADDFVLLNEFIGKPLQDSTQPHGSRLRQNPAETSLIANNYFNGIIAFDYNDVNDPLDVPGRFIIANAEYHWNGFGNKARGLMFGEAAYWQRVDLAPNQTYDLTVAYVNTSVAVAGVDFYDENWVHIGKADLPLAGIINVDFNGTRAAQDSRRFTVPAGTRYSTVFIWQAPGPLSQLLVVQTLLRPVR